jgi:hypothetical protein
MYQENDKELSYVDRSSYETKYEAQNRIVNMFCGLGFAIHDAFSEAVNFYPEYFGLPSEWFDSSGALIVSRQNDLKRIINFVGDVVESGKTKEEIYKYNYPHTFKNKEFRPYDKERMANQYDAVKKYGNLFEAKRNYPNYFDEFPAHREIK